MLSLNQNLRTAKQRKVRLAVRNRSFMLSSRSTPETKQRAGPRGAARIWPRDDGPTTKSWLRLTKNGATVVAKPSLTKGLLEAALIISTPGETTDLIWLLLIFSSIDIA